MTCVCMYKTEYINITDKHDSINYLINKKIVKILMILKKRILKMATFKKTNINKVSMSLLFYVDDKKK